ncbi:arabinogalactan endo-1,4-beta-galactosidase [Bifidobacterium amazonense]|uniref:Arabinogalactan endo-beta-1,4-galactanase n=1 Tax=Bifidobacterium amazonense TaxID=2809027 RepID=A0ABS9VYN2_9BIFI|nr:glycosyl hydrolase 53 family protein [Bifidobacterium amazonense]MCH9277227.1 arabinogalactan endo-1,4-beta-galactosidase [Bifidobacterium amazonense]
MTVTIANAGFEQTDDDGVVRGWTTTRPIHTTDEPGAAYSGRRSLLIDRENCDTLLSQDLTIEPGVYDLSLMAWANGPLKDSRFEANGEAVPIASAGAVQIDGEKTWDEIRLEGVRVETDGELDVRIYVEPIASPDFVGYIDDVAIERVGELTGGAAGATGDGSVGTDGAGEAGKPVWRPFVVRGDGPHDERLRIDGLADGRYTLTVMTRNAGGWERCYVYADGTGDAAEVGDAGEAGGAGAACSDDGTGVADVAAAATSRPIRAAVPRNAFREQDRDKWKRVTLRGIVVSGGALTIGVHAQADRVHDDPRGDVRVGSDVPSCEFDDWRLTRDERQDGEPYRLYIGGDITEVPYVVDQGGVFRDEAGNPVDPIAFAGANGWNIVRIRVFNETGKGHDGNGWYIPGGYHEVADGLKLARRAKAAGMAIQWSFHYSDTWTNPGLQMIPHAWARRIEGLTESEAVDELERLVYDYTADTLARLNAQGTTPEFVSLGNETRSGMLLPYGSLEHWDALARFYNAGARAVRELCPDSKIIIHVDDGGNTRRYLEYFGAARDHGVDYDVISSSFYPFWTQKSAHQFARFAVKVTHEFGKPIMIMETGFNWTGDTGSGQPGQLSNNGPYGGPETSSPELQRDFLIDLFNELRGVPDGMAIGDLYWDPVMIHANGDVHWSYRESDDMGGGNVVDNTTLFDFDGRALPAFDAYRYNS